MPRKLNILLKIEFMNSKIQSLTVIVVFYLVILKNYQSN